MSLPVYMLGDRTGPWQRQSSAVGSAVHQAFVLSHETLSAKGFGMMGLYDNQPHYSVRRHYVMFYRLLDVENKQ